MPPADSFFLGEAGIDESLLDFVDAESEDCEVVDEDELEDQRTRDVEAWWGKEKERLPLQHCERYRRRDKRVDCAKQMRGI